MPPNQETSKLVPSVTNPRPAVFVTTPGRARDKVTFYDAGKCGYGAVEGVRIHHTQLGEGEAPLSGLRVNVSPGLRSTLARRQRGRVCVAVASVLGIAGLVALILSASGQLARGGLRGVGADAPGSQGAEAALPGRMHKVAAQGPAPGYPTAAPSDPRIKIPAIIGCAEAFCEPHLTEAGQNFSDHTNIKLVDCLQRTGMGQADSKQCFQDSDVNASPVRKRLYACVVCKGCLEVSEKERKGVDCEQTKSATPSSGTAADWRQYTPNSYIPAGW